MFRQIQQGSVTVELDRGQFTTYVYLSRDWIGFGFIPRRTEQEEQALRNQAMVDRAAGIRPKNRGWKMHINIEDATPGNLERGWNSILPILQDKGIKSGKILNINQRGYMPFASNRADDYLYGKQITIYCYSQADDLNTQAMQSFWQEFATEITNTLRDNQVRCSPLPASDTTIAGSEFISYRDDSEGRDGPDPFAQITVNNNHPQAQQRPNYPVIPAPPPPPPITWASLHL